MLIANSCHPFDLFNTASRDAHHFDASSALHCTWRSGWQSLVYTKGWRWLEVRAAQWKWTDGVNISVSAHFILSFMIAACYNYDTFTRNTSCTDACVHIEEFTSILQGIMGPISAIFVDSSLFLLSLLLGTVFPRLAFSILSTFKGLSQAMMQPCILDSWTHLLSGWMNSSGLTCPVPSEPEDAIRHC